VTHEQGNTHSSQGEELKSQNSELFYSNLQTIQGNSPYHSHITQLLCVILWKGQEGDPVAFQAEQFRKRLTELRLKKNLSEYQLSYDLGKSRGYIQKISSGQALPSMSHFFTICEYFGITPSEFFDVDCQTPELVRELSSIAKDLDEENIQLLIGVAKGLRGKQETTAPMTP